MRGKSLFPPVPLREALQIATTIAEKNAGQPMRRLDVFHELKRSPDSGPSRNLVTASSGFGLTTGGYQAETLSLTDLGKRATVDRESSALVDAVLNVDIFRRFFETYKDRPIPADVAAKSFLASAGIPSDRTDACWDVMQENGRTVGLIREMAGGERILAREHAIELQGGEAPVEVPLERGGSEGEPRQGSQRRRGLPSLNINLEIHLPGDATAEQYDAIFSSMRKHLVDVE